MSQVLPLGQVEAQSVYRRIKGPASGDLYFKLNSTYHVRTILSEDGGTWKGAGVTELLDPEEQVKVVQSPSPADPHD